MSSFALADGPRDVRVGITSNPPISFTDLNGKPSGLAVDVINEIANRENWNVIFVEDLWVNLLKKIKSGEIDVLSGVAYSKERARQFDFNSESLTNNWGVVYRHPKASINSIFELEGKRLALTEKGIHTTSILKLLDDYSISIMPVFTDSFHDAMIQVDRGKADAAIINRLFGYAQRDEYAAIKTAIIFNPVQIRFISLKGQSGDLLTTIDSYLSDSKSDLSSSYYAHLNRWINIPAQTDIPQWVLWSLGVAVGMLLLAAAFILLLRQQVLAQTTSLRESEGNLRSALDNEKKYSALQQQFVSLVSHEFRTPLSIIDGTVQRIIRLKDKITPEQLVERGGKIRRAVERMTELIELTLYADRIDTGNIEIDIQPCKIRELVGEVCERQNGISPCHDIRIDLNEIPETIDADPKLLEHIFTNLLSNAVKYAPDNPLIEVSGEVKGDMVLVSIKDLGLGIPQDDLPHISERYFRTKIAQGIQGTGLGLSVCREFVEMHSGAIDVASVEGEGSIFTVRLPISHQASSN